jgi:hypothetical protein
MRDENDLLRALPLEDRLKIAAVDLAITGAPRALVEAAWLAADTQHQLDREEYRRYESGRTHEPDPI